MNISVSTLILAGGKSSRMKQDKALLEFKGKPLLLKIYDLAKQCNNLVYVVTPFRDKYKSILPVNCLFIEELIPFQSPLIAVVNSLEYLTSEWVFILACDLPLLTVDEVKSWLNYLPNLSAETVAFLPPNAKGWECLCGFYRLQYLTNLQDVACQGEKSLQKWLQNQIVAPIPIKNNEVLFNCNTLDDYQYILSFKQEK